MIKNICLSLFLAFVMCSCSRMSYIDEMKGEIINTDKAFCKLSIEKGMYEAFVQYADDSVVKPRDGNFPIIGKHELQKSFAGKSRPGFTLQWEPLKAEVAVSGELGYTFGNWKMNTKTETGADTILFGNYISIWKKQKDGTWKYVFDSGNDTPDPRNEKH